jgi:hypothetical protein
MLGVPVLVQSTKVSHLAADADVYSFALSDSEVVLLESARGLWQA